MTNIVWTEDSHDVRFTLGGMFRKGFTRDGILYEEREDFSLTLEEIKSGKLADVYILQRNCWF